MTTTLKVLYTGGQIAASAGTLYTSPANTTTLITQAAFTNTDTVARLLTVYIVRSGGAAGAANTLISARGLAAGETYVSLELPGESLAAGDFIQALADSASKITCAGISGYQIT